MSTQPATSAPVTWQAIFGTTVRLLTFRAKGAELNSLTNKHLIFGLFCTWIVGIGRYWDHPKADVLQHLGIGSVLYIFALSLLLFLIAWPLRPKNWSYRRVLTFVSLVSPPAILYAIPVERVFSFSTANRINFWFLAVVALWRVALLIYFLRVSARLNIFSLILATLLPLSLIVNALTALNLERAVFALMGGIQERTSNDEAFAALAILSLLSLVLFTPLIILYLWALIMRFVLKQRPGEF